MALSSGSSKSITRQPFAPSATPQQPQIISVTHSPPHKTQLPVQPVKWSKRLEVGRRLGNGRFGQVLLTRDRQSKRLFAVKLISKSFLIKYKSQHVFQREVENLASSQHPNVVKIYGWYHTINHVCIVMEFAPKGELYSILQREGPFSSRRASGYVAQVAAGLRYCQEHGIMHRDIKPENLLMGADNKIKIADFGSSAHDDGTPRLSVCGTLDYLAPELALKIPHDSKVDNWALGILAFEFLTKRPVFEESEKCGIKEAITTMPPKFPEVFDMDARDFICSLLKKNPKDRMSLSSVPSHRWVTKFSGREYFTHHW